jgi:hypothetical protein
MANVQFQQTSEPLSGQPPEQAADAMRFASFSIA